MSDQIQTVVPPSVAEETARAAVPAQHAARELATLEVHTPQDIEIASDLLKDVKRDLNRLIARKEEITKPLSAALKSVRDLFRPAEDAYKDAEAILKRKIGDAQLRIRQANEEAMRAAQAALAENNYRQAALASSNIQATQAPQGISFQAQYEWRVVDAAAIPREYLVPDEKKISAVVKAQGREAMRAIPGIVVEEKLGVVARTG